MHWELIPVFFAIAFIYASVGFGGGSSYLAVLSLYAMPFHEMRLIALLCNIIVVADGAIVFMRNKQVDFKKILPLILVSIPMAYLGATVKISERTFFILLGCCLVIAAVLLWVKTKNADGDNNDEYKKSNTFGNGILGGAIGFLSGMVGIGGGIFLSPVLNLMKWDTARKIAATASVFILFNSMAGIAGQLMQSGTGLETGRIWFLCAAVFIGGYFGSNMGAIKFNPLTIRRVTAILVFVAGMNVLLKHL